MNLVLSGPIDDSLRNLVVALTKPRRVVRLHDRADRMEGAADDAPTRAQVAALCETARVDHAYIEEGVSFADFKLLAMDMDSTLITIECIDEIADYAGKKAEVAAITEAAMRGEIDFAESLKRRVAALEGTDMTVLARVFDERLALSPGAAEIIQAAKRATMVTLLLSGGFTYFTDRLQTQLALDAAYANVLQCIAGTITGQIVGPVFDAAAKARELAICMRRTRCLRLQAIVIGDGANDIPMMRLVKYSVAYKAKAKVREEANLKINYGGLNILLDYFC